MARSEPLVLCCGSRSRYVWPAVKRTLARLASLIGPFTVLHGGARNADSDSGAVARILGLSEPVVIRPDWKRLGKRAGMFRNTAMLEKSPDYVIAFWDGVSRGTLDTIQKAVNVYRIPTIIVRESD